MTQMYMQEKIDLKECVRFTYPRLPVVTVCLDIVASACFKTENKVFFPLIEYSN